MIHTDKSFRKTYSMDYYDHTALISNSMIKTYLTSRLRYKQQYIDKSYQPKKTDALIIGSAVDCILTEGIEIFNKQYRVVKRRVKDDKDTTIQLTPAQFITIIDLSDRVKAQPVYNDITKGDDEWSPAIPQPILTDTSRRIKGKLDWLQVSRDGKKARIVDLKTAQDINPSKYDWHCKKYGYYRQMAIYAYLVFHNYDIPLTDIDCFHLVVEKDSSNLHNCGLFDFGKFHLSTEMDKAFDIIDEIYLNKDWSEQLVDWDNVISLMGDVTATTFIEY